MIKVFFATSEKNNLFGVNKVVKELTLELNKYYSIVENFSDLELLSPQKKILHIHGCWSLKVFVYFLIAKLFKIKIILSPHGMIDPYSFSQKVIKKKIAWILFQKIIFNFSDIIIASSPLEKKNINNLVKNSKTKIIPHGISMEKNFIKKKNDKREIRFVYFSRIHPVKNLEKLVDIWINSNFFKKFRLDIFGEISDIRYFNNIKNKISKKKNIKYRGPLYKKKIKQLSKYDVFLFPSVSENFGLVVLEALSAGLYLIINKGLPWKSLEKQKFATLIKYEKKNLIYSIKYIQKNKSKIFSHKKNLKLKNFILKNYNWPQISKNYLDIYNKV